MKEKELLEKILKLGKIILVVLVAIFIVLTVGVSKMYTSNVSTSSNSEEDSQYNTDYDVSMFKEITASKISAETKKSKQVVYIGRESCGWCAAFLPNLWQAQEEFDFTTLYVDLAKIIDFSTGAVSDQDSFEILSKLTGDNYDGYMEENLGATPMILIVEKGKIIGAQTGYSEYDTFKKILEDAGY